jgi:predicted ABC-type ATPase
MPAGHPTFWLIAGPNGVGKTTYAMRHLKAVSGSINFVNMDEIARGLSPLEPVAAQTEAARIALARARAFIREKATFAMEAALAGRTRLNLMQEALAQGLSTALLYSSVRDPTICLERIARRVAEGGHDVEASVVRRRFLRSLANLPAYRSASDLWRIYEVSGPKPALALEGRRGEIRHRDDALLATAHPLLSRA